MRSEKLKGRMKQINDEVEKIDENKLYLKVWKMEKEKVDGIKQSGKLKK
jgi:hypothetical protein